MDETEEQIPSEELNAGETPEVTPEVTPEDSDSDEAWVAAERRYQDSFSELARNSDYFVQCDEETFPLNDDGSERVHGKEEPKEEEALEEETLEDGDFEDPESVGDEDTYEEVDQELGDTEEDASEEDASEEDSYIYLDDEEE